MSSISDWVSTRLLLYFVSGWWHLWLLLVGRCLCQVFADEENEGSWNGRRTWNLRVEDDGDETAALWTEESDGGAEANVPGKILCSEQCSLSICMCGCCIWPNFGYGLEVKLECCCKWNLNVDSMNELSMLWWWTNSCCLVGIHV